MLDLTTTKLSGARIMADSDNTTTVPFVTPGRKRRTEPKARSADWARARATTVADPAIAVSLAWTEAHAATAEQCLRQQRLETELIERGSSADGVDGQATGGAGRVGRTRRTYAVAKAVEALAVAHEEELLERLARTPATSLAGVAAKLSVIVTEAEENADPTDFPVPHIRSALEDIRRLMRQANADPGQAAGNDGEVVGSPDPAPAQR